MAQTRVKSDKEIEAMRESGRMLATVLAKLKTDVKAGMTTLDADAIAKKELKKLGGEPAFYGYQGFPATVCSSINQEVVHGIPSDKEINKGDIVSFDFGVTYQGMITDAAFSMIIDGEDPQQLVALTERSLYAGIDVVKNGVHIGDIGQAVSAVLEPAGFGIIRDLVGHGVGHDLHEEPNIPNHGVVGEGPTLKTGMTIAIEPMASLGTHEVMIKDDGWTVETRDHSLSAHFEHTVLITETGYEILTALPEDNL